MKILVYGAGVIGTTYAWQLTQAGQDITLLVRPGKAGLYAGGIPMRCRDERSKPAQQIETTFQPKIVESFAPEDGYDLILVCVRSNQVEETLPVLAACSGIADILFFQNNWWGDEKIRAVLRPGSYFFGFSRIVGGWRKGNGIESIIFNNPGMGTMLGEADGRVSPRVKSVQAILQTAQLNPEVSADILGWLKYHYVEYLGATGAILEAGSVDRFADQTESVRKAILATREALAVCRARGVPAKSAPFNLRLFGLPLPLLVWIGAKQYQASNIKSFFKENIDSGMVELSAQYQDVIGEGRRLGIAMPTLTSFAGHFKG
jgi:ketopantoate reductase